MGEGAVLVGKRLRYNKNSLVTLKPAQTRYTFFFLVRALGFIFSLSISYFWSDFAPLYHPTLSYPTLPYPTQNMFKVGFRARALRLWISDSFGDSKNFWPDFLPGVSYKDCSYKEEDVFCSWAFSVSEVDELGLDPCCDATAAGFEPWSLWAPATTI